MLGRADGRAGGGEEEMVSLIGRRDGDDGGYQAKDGFVRQSGRVPLGVEDLEQGGGGGEVMAGQDKGACVLVISIGGMHCSSCSNAVESALREIPGVHRASVALMQEMGEIEYDGGLVEREDILQAVRDVGFDVGVLEDSGMDARFGTSSDRVNAKFKLVVNGMHCTSCSTAVEKALKKLKGVVDASVSLSTGRAEVTFVPGSLSSSEVVKAVQTCGFSATDIVMDSLDHCSEIILNIDGMTCSSCSSAVEMALGEADGVIGVRVNLMANTADVKFDPSSIGPRDIISLIDQIGFEATLREEGKSYHDQNQVETARFKRLATWSSVFTVPVFFISMVFPWMGVFDYLYEAMIFGFPLDEVLKCLLVTPVQFLVGWPFHYGAYKALRSRRANMDVLISFGTNASYLYSMISILHHHFMSHHESGDYSPTDFFETSAMLITFVLVGKYLESSVRVPHWHL